MTHKKLLMGVFQHERTGKKGRTFPCSLGQIQSFFLLIVFSHAELQNQESSRETDSIFRPWTCLMLKFLFILLTYFLRGTRET